ncbi:MAG: diphosphomevalonate decarboxylase [Proteobacteria bacterium]|nr:diphosphomevalonate decarboxylase [Pseudomonadota bacterium]
MDSVIVQASPSLALVKYWGKQQVGKNIPATSSLGVTLDRLVTTTSIECTTGQDSVTIDGVDYRDAKVMGYLSFLKNELQLKDRFIIDSSNNFPGASGLASSSSGNAALALGLSQFSKKELTQQQLSRLAQVGSGSAARSVFGGFTTMKAGSDYAEQLYSADFWPDLRIIVCAISTEKKEISSGDAMNHVRDSSVFYKSWLESSKDLFRAGLLALKNRNLELLGSVMQRSYKQMVATMLGADPPILYWLPQSIELVHFCHSLRRRGIGAWETMDAGPQVKILCLASELSAITSALANYLDENQIIVAKPGNAPILLRQSEFQVNAVS